MFGRFTCFLFVVTCLCFSQTVADPYDEAIGHVTSMNGLWQDDSCHCRIDQGHTVKRGSRVVRQGTPRSSNYLRIRFWANPDKEETFACEALNCNEPLDILSRVHDNHSSQLARYLRATLQVVVESLSPDGERTRTLSAYSATISRGPGDAPLADAFVFADEGGTLDLSEALGKNHKDAYRLDWCEVGPSGTPACAHPPAPVTARSVPGGKVLWKPESIQSGLYEIFVCSDVEGQTVRGRSAFLLVAHSKREATAMRTEYKTFESLMKGWNPYERSMLLHAFMRHLYPNDNR